MPTINTGDRSRVKTVFRLGNLAIRQDSDLYSTAFGVAIRRKSGRLSWLYGRPNAPLNRLLAVFDDGLRAELLETVEHNEEIERSDGRPPDHLRLVFDAIVQQSEEFAASGHALARWEDLGAAELAGWTIVEATTDAD